MAQHQKLPGRSPEQALVSVLAAQLQAQATASAPPRQLQASAQVLRSLPQTLPVKERGQVQV